MNTTVEIDMSENLYQPPAKKVLVVDNDADHAISLQLLLDIAGYQARVAFNGDQALKAALDWRPQAVILDIGLPDRSGFDVARELNAWGWRPRPHLIALTGYGRPQDLRRSDEAGIDVHLVKPVDMPVLREILDSVFIPIPAGASVARAG